MDSSKKQALDQLREELANYDPEKGTGLFDHEAEAEKATVRERALTILDYRARSTHELRSLLKERLEDADPDVIEEVLADLTDSRLLDDETFAREWVRQRLERRGKSTRILDKELREKGVAANIRAAVLAEVDPQKEEDVARQLAYKKARSVKTVPEDRKAYDKELRKVVGVLARRGFPAGSSMSIAREYLDARIQELTE
ncbi:recombination regulator RecX [Corynebacterium renale]|uniref:regulatory protein RecX n=1 Tax=Corynebacterium renale TaxID=1724 RepID=UPI000DA3217E|nr:regulatory protein RecX [Corynebacterium renale]SQG64858.1 recombination regulator RecX [Corynebacterium renale]STC96452.1 recombination regulator RecX [Corynebacterium renale]